MMRLFFLPALWFSLLSFAFSQNNIATGQWRLHLNYGTTLGLTETPNYLYSFATSGFYRYDKENGEKKRIMKTDGFTSLDVTAMNYNADLRILLIAYAEGILDVVKNDRIIPVFDINRANIIGEKTVNGIYFDGKFAYLSCSFGLVGYDLERMETKFSYLNIGTGAVYDATIFHDSLFLSAENGFYKAPLTGKNLSDPTSWQLDLPGRSIACEVYKDNIYLVSGNQLLAYNNSAYTQMDSGNEYGSIHVRFDKMLVCKKDTLLFFDENGLQNTVYSESARKAAISMNDAEEVWHTTQGKGTVLHRKDGNLLFTSPNGPWANTFGELLNVEDDMWVTGGAITENYSFNYVFNGVYKFTDNHWESSYEGKINIPDSLYDLYAICKDPASKDIYISAYQQGICVYDGNATTEFINAGNSPLTLSQASFIAGMKFDKNDNLWVSNYGAPFPLKARDRQGNWRSFKPGSIGNLAQIEIGENNYKWIVAPRSTSWGLLVYDDNNTLLDATDDKYRILNTAKGGGALPVNDVRGIAIDKDGEVWIGTSSGLCVFYNTNSALEAGVDAQRIIIGNNDNAGYLLGNEYINAIAVDGGNRKWIGTKSSGVWVVSPDGERILANYNTQNSPLLSDNVMKIAINGKSGEVFFATDKGIISFRSDATEAKETHAEVLVFPNPVLNAYNGPITINGLVKDAYVKITDLSGNVIYETKAWGGTATWNGIGLNGKKAKPGVYTIFSGDKAGEDTEATKLLILDR